MTFDRLGAALHAERERRGLRIEEAADHLKISARHLRALEEGDGDALPHPAYARGFIRSYAAYLGMSSDEIHNALNSVMTDEGAQQPPAFTSEPAPRERGGGRGGCVLVLVLALVAGGAFAMWHWGLPVLSSLEKPRLAQPSPSLTSAQPASVADAAKIPTKGSEREAAQTVLTPGAAPAAQRQETPHNPPSRAETQGAPSGAQVGQSAAISAPQQDRTEATPLLATRQATGATVLGASTGRESADAAPAAAAGDEAGIPGQHKVIITATEECWIHSNADRSDTRQFSLRKGDTFALTFARSLELKLGNAGGVRIRYDGESLPPPGQSGQVKTLTFPPRAGQ